MAVGGQVDKELLEKLWEEKEQFKAESRHHESERHRLDQEVRGLQDQVKVTKDKKKRDELQDEVSLLKAKSELANSKGEKAYALARQRLSERLKVRGGVWAEGMIQRWKKKAEQCEDEVKKNEEVVGKLEKKREQYEESLRLLEEALAGGYFTVRIVVCVVVGPAGVGKTCFKFLLLDKKAPGLRSSTSCAEAPIQVQVREVSAEQFRKLGKKWKAVDTEKLLPLIARYIRCLSAEKGEAIPSELKAYLEQLEASVATEGVANAGNATADDMEAGQGSEGGGASAFSLPDDRDPSTSEAAILKEMIDDVLGKLQKLIAGEELSEEEVEDLFSAVWIYVTDSGGQPQFHELLPLFVHDVSSVVVVSRLSDRLDEYPLDEFYKDGELVGKRLSTHLTAEEQIKCLIRSLLSRTSADTLPKVIMVGTHRDKAGDCSESIEQKNEKLIEMLGQEFSKHLIYNGSSKQLLFPLNTLNPSDEDKEVAASIKAAIESSIAKEVQVPIWWYLLQLLIQGLAKKLKKNVLSKKLCASIAHALGFTDASFHAALEFFDRLNVIKYSSALPDVVFVRSQIPLDKLSQMIEYSYKLKHGGHSAPVEGEWKECCEKGIVTLDFLRSFSEHYEKDIFEAPQLLELLKHQLVAVPLAKLDSSPDSAVDHFMPSLLDILPREELEKHRVFTSAAAPLLFRFSHGCRRAGVFCCLAVHLMMHSWWSIQHKDGKLIFVARNCIAFRHPKYACFITLIDAFYYIEAHVEALPSVCYKVCPLIRDSVLCGIGAACEKLTYINDAPHLAFFCPHASTAEAAPPPSTELRHAAVVEKEDNCCACTKTKVFSILNEKQTIWLQDADLGRELDLCPPQAKIAKTEQQAESSNTIRSSHLKLIKWKDDKGEIHKFYLMDKISHKWRDIGELLDLSHAELETISMKCREDPKECCRAVLGQWLDNPPEGYPTTWDGLIELLDDSQLGQVASQVKDIVDKATVVL